MKKALLLCCSVSLLTLSLLAQQSINETFEGVQEIQINTGTGDLVIDESNNNAVALTVEYDADRIEPKIKHSGKKLILDEKQLDRNKSGKIKWTLRIPDELIVTANLGTGRTDINGVYIKLKHNTGTGAVHLAGVSGNLTVNSGTGHIDVSQSKGRFDLNSGTGNLSLDNVSGKFSLNSGTGNVKVVNSEATDESSLNSGTGNVSLVLSKPATGDLSLNSGTGNATLEFNGQTIAGAFEMSCSEKHGSISAPFDFDHTERIDNGGRNNFTLKKTAKIGSGGPKIKVSTGTGKATVKN